jgi:hypothetical protein
MTTASWATALEGSRQSARPHPGPRLSDACSRRREWRSAREELGHASPNLRIYRVGLPRQDPAPTSGQQVGQGLRRAVHEPRTSPTVHDQGRHPNASPAARRQRRRQLLQPLPEWRLAHLGHLLGGNAHQICHPVRHGLVPATAVQWGAPPSHPLLARTPEGGTTAMGRSDRAEHCLAASGSGVRPLIHLRI